jgi:RNA polymerase sigma factor (sigma-70 family)
MSEELYFAITREDDGQHYHVVIPQFNKTERLVETDETTYWLLKSFQQEDWRQERQARRHLERLSLSEEELLDRADIFVPSPEELLHRHILTEELRRAFEKLPPVQARRFLLHYGLELSVSQIAESEQCGSRTIRHSLELAKKNLRKILKK